MPDFVDPTGRALTDYPRPSVAVDTALLTVDQDDELAVLLVSRTDGRRRTWALPGTFLHEGERLADAVRRSLRSKAGVSGLTPRQLHVLDDPKRDDRGWVLSVAHLDTVRHDVLAAAISGKDDVAITPISALPRLAFDHASVVDLAVESLRATYADRPDPSALLAQPFTLAQLQRVHEAVAGEAMPKDTFRRRMEPLLRETGGSTEGVVGRPARLFKRR